MSFNPFEDADEKTRRTEDREGLELATVVDAPSDANHQVAIEVMTETGFLDTATRPTNASAVVPKRGDVAVPSEGDMVLVARLKSRKPVVVGTVYDDGNEVRDYGPDERHVGSDDGPTFVHGTFGVVPKVSSDPSGAVDGAVWYRTDLDEYRGVENGTTVSFNTTAV